MKAFQGTPAVYLGNEIGQTCVVVAMEDIAMLVFWLPIIIFEGMFEAKDTRAGRPKSTAVE
jgi:hypothetical protein